jgi:hypothetical protein
MSESAPSKGDFVIPARRSNRVPADKSYFKLVIFNDNLKPRAVRRYFPSALRKSSSAFISVNGMTLLFGISNPFEHTACSPGMYCQN